MLIVSENYNELNSVVKNEAKFDYGRDFTADEVKRELRVTSSDKRLATLVDKLYAIWRSRYKSEPTKIPFRFSVDNIAKVYIAPIYMDDITKMFNGNQGLSIDRNDKLLSGGFRYGGINFMFSNGSMFKGNKDIAVDTPNNKPQDGFNWYSVRSKSFKGSMIIEFRMSVKQNAEGIPESDFVDAVNREILINKKRDDTESNLKGSHNYDAFEINAMNYLNNLCGDVFRRVGGNDSKHSDLVLRYNNNFWVECKMNPEARGGQFKIKEEDGKIILSTISLDDSDLAANKDVNDDVRNLIKKFEEIALTQLNDIYNENKQDGDPFPLYSYLLENGQIHLNKVSSEMCKAYVIGHYANKHVQYFITGRSESDFIIVPLHKLDDVFNIDAICRFKRNNSNAVPGGYSDEVMSAIYDSLEEKGFDYIPNKTPNWYKTFGAVQIASDKSSIEIETNIDGVDITLVFDKKDSSRIKKTKSSK